MSANELPCPITDAELAALPLDPALDELLDEILAQQVQALPVRRHWRVVVAAVAAVAVLATVPVYLASRGRQPGPAPTPEGQPSKLTQLPQLPKKPAPPAVEPWVAPTNFYALESAGWRIDPSTVTSSKTGVSVSYISGQKYFTLDWTVTRLWRGVRDSAAEEQPFTDLEVFGIQGQYVEYESQQQMVYLPPVDGYGLRIDGTFTTPDEFKALLGQLRSVDAPVLPDEIVAPDEIQTAVDQAVAGVEAPDGFVAPRMVGWNGTYQVAATVLSDVGCAWTDRFVRGRPGDREAAIAALEGSRQWPLLTEPPVSWSGWFEDTVKAMRRPDSKILRCGESVTAGHGQLDKLPSVLADTLPE